MIIPHPAHQVQETLAEAAYTDRRNCSPPIAEGPSLLVRRPLVGAEQRLVTVLCLPFLREGMQPFVKAPQVCYTRWEQRARMLYRSEVYNGRTAFRYKETARDLPQQ
jgi:hypothetical protein